MDYENAGLIRRIVSGDLRRKSRFHDEKGNFVGWHKIMRHAPRSTISWCAHRLLGRRPVLPWLGYSVISLLKQHLNKTSRVLEYGCGMSTIWLAQHAGAVISVEDSPAWAKKISSILRRGGYHNASVTLAANDSDFVSFMETDAGGFDLILIDGGPRSACVAEATSKLRRGGIILLDNTDKGMLDNSDMRKAESLLRDFAVQQHAAPLEITDFYPTLLFVGQAMLVKIDG